MPVNTTIGRARQHQRTLDRRAERALAAAQAACMAANQYAASLPAEWTFNSRRPLSVASPNVYVPPPSMSAGIEAWDDDEALAAACSTYNPYDEI